MTTLDQIEEMSFFDIWDKILTQLLRMRGVDPPQEIIHMEDSENIEEDNKSP